MTYFFTRNAPERPSMMHSPSAMFTVRISGMFGAANFPAGRGKDENPRGGAKGKIHGAGRGGAKKRVN